MPTIDVYRLRHLAALCLGMIAFATGAVRAQPAMAGSTMPAFDVASIRPCVCEGVRSHISNSPRNGEFNAVNVTVRDLLEVAFSIPETQMPGGPDWTATARFNVQAKADPAVTERLTALPADEAKLVKREMLQALLADRFRLSAHREDRDMPAFSLVIAKGGSKLVSTTSSVTDLTGGRGRINIKGGNDSVAVLAFELSWRLDRPVIDRTGLSGRYQITLTWADEDAASPGPGQAPSGPSLFTAIQEQLGLKLQPDRGPVPVLIIDHAERPSEN